MRGTQEKCTSLRVQIAATEAQLASLKHELANAERAAAADSESADAQRTKEADQDTRRWPLLQEEYRRYGRQMIVPQVGLEGESWPKLSRADGHLHPHSR